MNNFSLGMLKKTEFKILYKKLLLQDELSSSEKVSLLKLALIFINCEPVELQKLGYRIVLAYSNYTGDYIPLYDLSINFGYVPLAKLIEKKIRPQNDSSFFREFQSSYKENFKNENVYFTEQQLDLNVEFRENLDSSFAVIAPTSYGKSELIISSISSIEGNICIIVPTKALVSQFKRRIMQSGKSAKRKVITHPEMFFREDKNIIAVLTQERLMRLLRKNENLSFDTVFIDEAHNILERDSRNTLLASSIIVLKSRSTNTNFKFLTPFLMDQSNLHIKHADFEIKSNKIDEYIKSEKFFLCDFREDSNLEIYDQFLDEYFLVENLELCNEIDLMLEKKGKKNIIYLNKPSSIEKFCRKAVNQMKIIKSKRIEEICSSLANYLHKDYFLIKCLKHGLVYHHGSVPDNIKLYLEHVFSKESELEFIATTSTLLEGVNIPAEKLFLLDYKRGRGRLSPSQFKNLVGRVGRFREVFDKSGDNLHLLEPEIYVVGSEFISSKANIKKFLEISVKIDKEISDDPQNVLLVNTPSNDEVVEDLYLAEEFIENFEPGTLNKKSVRYALTKFGEACFANSLTEIDILTCENQCQSIVDSILIKQDLPKNVNELLELISELFVPFLEDNNVSRLSEEKARKFYAMFLQWRIDHVSFGQMIGSFLFYWKKVEKKDPFVFVGNKWGEISRDEDDYSTNWVNIAEKDEYERVNLAIVRIKEEQDFVDNHLIKYVEVLYDLGVVTQTIYDQIKYGTSDASRIVLMKNGVSSTLAGLLLSKYNDSISINKKDNVVSIDAAVCDLMRSNKENDILLFELESSLGLN